MTACKHDKNIVNKLIVGYPGSFYIIQNNCVPYPQNKIKSLLWIFQAIPMIQ